MTRTVPLAAIAIAFASATPSFAQFSGGPVHTTMGRPIARVGGLPAGRGLDFRASGFSSGLVWGFPDRAPFASVVVVPPNPITPFGWNGFGAPSATIVNAQTTAVGPAAIVDV